MLASKKRTDKIVKSIMYFYKNPVQLLVVPLTKLPYFNFLRKTSYYNTRVNFEFWFKQKILNLGQNKDAYWPVHPSSKVYDAQNIFIGIDSAPGIMGGAYITGIGGLFIGSYCFFAKNIVIVTANHNPYDLRERVLAPVKIGNYCWLGAGAKIMPGVTLGDFTIVAAGAVVTKSFKEGFIIVGGIPAKPIKNLDKAKCILYEHSIKYHGYLDEKEYLERISRQNNADAQNK